MPIRFLTFTSGKWVSALVVALLLLMDTAATAQTEPTLKQIYDTAQSGQLDKAQVMMQQVLVLHPNSARAHFVQAELFARQGDLSRSRDALAAAEKIAPGLPFANSEAVQGLRAQLRGDGNRPATRTPAGPALSNGNAAGNSSAAAVRPNSPGPSIPWGLVLIGGAIIVGVLFFMKRKKSALSQPGVSGAAAGFPPATSAGMQTGGQSGGLSGPQSFGMGTGAAPTPGQPGQQGFGQQPYPPYGQNANAGSGMGSRIAGGLATGAAVGAGMMAAQALGRSLGGNGDGVRNGDHRPNEHGAAGSNNIDPVAGNPNADMGGQNFGVEDTGNWDDAGNDAGGVADAGDMGGGGGDWDT